MVNEKEVNLDEEKKKAVSFKEHYTFVFVVTPSNFYNGYICQICKNDFMFLDQKIPYPFPIRWDTLKYPIVPSERIPDASFNKKFKAVGTPFINDSNLVANGDNDKEEGKNGRK